VVDVSRSMQWGGRLEMVQAGLRSLVSQLGPSDRLSLVVYSDQAEALIEDAGPEQADYLLSAIDLLRPRSWTNVGAGLQLGYAIATSATSIVGQTRRVALICDGLAGLEAGEAARIESALTAAGKQVSLTIVDLSREVLADPQLESFAKAAGGRLSRATSTAQVRWALTEALSGQSQTVASDVSLTVTFNPQVVAGYRLLGHEATLLTARPETDLRAGQTAVGLYELQLKPQGDNVGVAQVSWRDPRTGQRQTVSQRITRASFAPQFSGTAEALQLATLYAETAEVLRRSPFREGVTLFHIRELAEEASSQVRENPSYRELTAMLQSAQRARPSRGGLPAGWNRRGGR
jgi:Ca-activated chloride channel family protein